MTKPQVRKWSQKLDKVREALLGFEFDMPDMRNDLPDPHHMSVRNSIWEATGHLAAARMALYRADRSLKDAHAFARDPEPVDLPPLPESIRRDGRRDEE